MNSFVPTWGTNLHELSSLVICDRANLYALLETIPECVFVEIGANDGVVNDPLHGIIKENKWTGILVEPHPGAFEELQQTYAGIDGLIFEQAVISEESKEIEFFYPQDGDSATTQHASLSKDYISNMYKLPPQVLKVTSMTPSQLLHKHNITQYDVLMIDTEGYDFKILKAFPLDTIPPAVIQLEVRHIHNEGDRVKDVVEWLSAHNYQCYADEGMSDITAILKS
jgi:FkbM family methyltransferase